MNINAANLYPSIIDLLVTYADWFFDKEIKETDFYVTLEAIVNGETDENRGIDNKGFDLKSVDKTSKTSLDKDKTHLRNHSGEFNQTVAGEMKRSQSINSLTDDNYSHDSPKPVTRRKNKSAAPVPPGIKDDKKKPESKSASIQISTPSKSKELVGDKPDKPPRPNVPTTSTLPRPGKNHRENKSTETSKDDIMTQSVGAMGFENFSSEQVSESPGKQDMHLKREKIQKATASTNTEPIPKVKEFGSVERRIRDKPIAAPRSISCSAEGSENEKQESDSSKTSEYYKVDLINAKKEWLLGKNNSENDSTPLKKPAIPERPSTLKQHALKARTSVELNLRINNYENVSLSSNENLSGGSSDERTLQKAQLYSIDKQQVSIINVGNDEKGKKGEDETAEESCQEDKESSVEVSAEKERKDSISSRSLSLPGK